MGRSINFTILSIMDTKTPIREQAHAYCNKMASEPLRHGSRGCRAVMPGLSRLSDGLPPFLIRGFREDRGGIH